MLPVVVIGFGGHGRVVAAALVASGRKVIAATDRQNFHLNQHVTGIKIMSDEMMLDRIQPGDVELTLGVGAVIPCWENSPRRGIVCNFKKRGYRFATVCHPAAWVAPDAQIGEGVQIHAGAIVQPGVTIGAFTILNSRSPIDHDCQIGEFCHLAPGATVSADVTIDHGSHLGTGCNVIQGIRIGYESFIAAGATVVRDVGPQQSVRGTPARSFQPRFRFT